MTEPTYQRLRWIAFGVFALSAVGGAWIMRTDFGTGVLIWGVSMVAAEEVRP